MRSNMSFASRMYFSGLSFCLCAPRRLFDEHDVEDPHVVQRFAQRALVALCLLGFLASGVDPSSYKARRIMSAREHMAIAFMYAESAA